MKFKINPKPKVLPTKTFLLFPRYCDKCECGYTLCTVPLVGGEPYCPTCNCYLWWDKKTAIKHFKLTN